MKAWFISDLHLKSLNERNGNYLLRFLHFVKEDPGSTHLFFLGDIFDFWVGNHDFYQVKFQALIDEILKIKDQGKKIYYFEGNHDLHVQKYWAEKLNIECFIDDHYFELGQITVRAGHGDLINPVDKAYQRYRHVVRHPLMEKVAQNIPAKTLSKVGDWLSKYSRKKSSVVRRTQEDVLRQMIRDYAEKSYSEKPFDFIINGHMHVKDEFEFKKNSRSIYSINLGSWFEEPTALWIDGTTHGWVDIKSL